MIKHQALMTQSHCHFITECTRDIDLCQTLSSFFPLSDTVENIYFLNGEKVCRTRQLAIQVGHVGASAL